MRCECGEWQSDYDIQIGHCVKCLRGNRAPTYQEFQDRYGRPPAGPYEPTSIRCIGGCGKMLSGNACCEECAYK
jgi:hypothetical protein